jgi:dTDP-4-dehydrorhamnose reductase
LLFGPTLTRRETLFEKQVQALRAGQPLACFADEWRSPLGLAAAARALIALAESDFEGLLHIGGPERLSRLEMGQRLAAFLGVDPGTISASSREEAADPEPRPRDTSLISAKWRGLFPAVPWPVWHESLAEMAALPENRGRL